MEMPYSRILKRKSPNLRRGRWITLGSALAFWLLLAGVAATVLPSGILQQEERQRRMRALNASTDLTNYLGDRLRMLHFLATVPASPDAPYRVEALRSALREYPEFSKIVTAHEPPPRGKGKPLCLVASDERGGLVVAQLRDDWIELVPSLKARFGPRADGRHCLVVSGSEPRCAAVVAPPDSRSLQALPHGEGGVLRWGDGKPYVTAVAHLIRGLPTPHPALMVVSAVPLATVEAHAALARKWMLGMGLALGFVTGLVGCVVLGWATRRLREANDALEARVAARTVELQVAERSYRDIFENVPIGLYECDPNGGFLRVNPSLARTLGYETPEAMIASLGSLHAIGDRDWRAGFMRRIVEEGEVLERTMLADCLDGRSVWLAERARAIRNEEGRIVLIEGTMQDVTAQLELETRLRQIGATDPLTGLLNRRGLSEAIEAAQLPVSFVTLDVDRFKDFNDAYGHPAGDRALQAVAEVLRRTAREGDAVARAGGEEFVVVLSRTGPEAARRIAETLRAAVAAYAALETRLTLSGGVATAASIDEVDEAFVAADRALYLAKQSGRDRIVVNPAKLA